MDVAVVKGKALILYTQDIVRLYGTEHASSNGRDRKQEKKKKGFISNWLEKRKAAKEERKNIPGSLILNTLGSSKTTEINFKSVFRLCTRLSMSMSQRKNNQRSCHRYGSTYS